MVDIRAIDHVQIFAWTKDGVEYKTDVDTYYKAYSWLMGLQYD